MSFNHKDQFKNLDKKPNIKLVTKLEDLAKFLALAPATKEMLLAEKKFPFLAPKNFIQQIQKGNRADPLLKQILPSAKELASPADFRQDPLQETQYNPLPGLLHKYENRALILLTKNCLIHCRYCFRKEFPYRHNLLSNTAWQKILQYLQEQPKIQEVILSGGDPLTLSNACLAKYIAALATIPQLTTLRVHSRVPIVYPARIQPEFLNLLTATRLKPVLVTHCNHPNEITNEVATTFKQFLGKNITLLNQTVLLKDINDNAATLVTLSQKLFAIGILPYYLHSHDKVIGSAHFAITTRKAKRLFKELAAKLPGYLVPRLVKELPGMPFKCPV